MKQLVWNFWNSSYTFDASAGTLTINQRPKTLTLESLLAVVNTTDQEIIYQPNKSTKGATLSWDVFTLEWDTTAMNNTDKLMVLIDTDDVAYDANLDVNKVIPQSYAIVQNTDSQNLVTTSDIWATNDTRINQGVEIDVRWSKTFLWYIELTVNNSTGNQIQILTKTENAWSDEYVRLDTDQYQVTLWDANIKVQLEDFDTSGVSYIQVQSKATVVWATEWTVTIDYTLVPLT